MKSWMQALGVLGLAWVTMGCAADADKAEEVVEVDEPVAVVSSTNEQVATFAGGRVVTWTSSTSGREPWYRSSR